MIVNIIEMSLCQLKIGSSFQTHVQPNLNLESSCWLTHFHQTLLELRILYLHKNTSLGV